MNAENFSWKELLESYQFLCFQSPSGILVWLPAQAGCSRAGCWGCIQLGLEYLHRWRHHSLSEWPVPVLGHLCWKAAFGWCLCPLLLVLPVGSVQVHPPSGCVWFSWQILVARATQGTTLEFFLSCYKWSDTLFIKFCILCITFFFISSICLDFWIPRCNSQYSFLIQIFFKRPLEIPYFEI